MVRFAVLEVKMLAFLAAMALAADPPASEPEPDVEVEVEELDPEAVLDALIEALQDAEATRSAYENPFVVLPGTLTEEQVRALLASDAPPPATPPNRADALRSTIQVVCTGAPTSAVCLQARASLAALEPLPPQPFVETRAFLDARFKLLKSSACLTCPNDRAALKAFVAEHPEYRVRAPKFAQ